MDSMSRWIGSPALALFAACPFVGCSTEPRCEKSIEAVDRTFNTVTAAGAPIADFILRQNYASYSPPGCRVEGTGGPITLRIRSTSSVPMWLTYTLRAYDPLSSLHEGPVLWTYNGSVGRLGAGESVDV